MIERKGNLQIVCTKAHDVQIQHSIYNSWNVYSKPSSDLADGYVCNICGLVFLTPQALAAHIDSEHPEAEQPEVL